MLGFLFWRQVAAPISDGGRRITDWRFVALLPRHSDPAFYTLLASSYARLLGKPLVPEPMPVAEAAAWLYDKAPFAILAHNTAPDPVFVYGNKAAQRRFEYDWDELTRLPSRLSAEAPNREERQRFLERVQQRGYESGYKGVRITSLVVDS